MSRKSQTGLDLYLKMMLVFQLEQTRSLCRYIVGVFGLEQQVVSKDHVKMVVWERGAGRTLACGTGACALVVAGVLEGRINRVCRVDLPGGPLDIEWRKKEKNKEQKKRN
eukprot:TRINITY_DN83481_c0_g1_i3.p3 TRINITY_DN83481_c0_g1~~TRINITY_DN83481_c0_g1_i3.p3  ORF type:complete len:110 (-),score=19.85 TRINITY_DN83481_c0_g1_i3:33-362(-)